MSGLPSLKKLRAHRRWNLPEQVERVGRLALQTGPDRVAHQLQRRPFCPFDRGSVDLVQQSVHRHEVGLAHHRREPHRQQRKAQRTATSRAPPLGGQPFVRRRYHGTVVTLPERAPGEEQRFGGRLSIATGVERVHHPRRRAGLVGSKQPPAHRRPVGPRELHLPLDIGNRLDRSVDPLGQCTRGHELIPGRVETGGRFGGVAQDLPRGVRPAGFREHQQLRRGRAGHVR